MIYSSDASGLESKTYISFEGGGGGGGGKMMCVSCEEFGGGGGGGVNFS